MRAGSRPFVQNAVTQNRHAAAFDQAARKGLRGHWCQHDRHQRIKCRDSRVTLNLLPG
jgi:hypothetical protein